MTTTDEMAEHLAVCRTCRELDDLYQELFGQPEASPLPQGSMENWKTAEEERTTGEKSKGKKGPRALPQANTCPACGGWKKAQYPTCFKCSGMMLCESCGENYHSEEYDECYDCHVEDEWE